MSSVRKISLADLDYSVLQQCMHCGMCLPSCPTYLTTKRERHSPRGRIALMRAVADGDFSMGEALADEMDYCLGCLACTSACPAGVDYGAMFETARAEGREHRPTGMGQGLRRLIFEGLFLHPRRLQMVGKCLRIYQRSGLEKLALRLRLPFLFGRRMGEIAAQSPTMEAAFSDEQIGELEVPAPGVLVRGRVAMLSGCVQAMAFATVNRATVDVLLANGWEVHTPRLQACCGSLHAHNGEPALATRAAEELMGQICLDQCDAVITNAGGCGSHLKHYRTLLGERAETWDRKVKDIHEFLVETGFRNPASDLPERRLTYHESCHLCHGQGIRDQPRELLRAIPGVELVELPESDLCCGSAGIYNVLQPEESRKLAERKVQRIRETEAAVVATANPGCHLQIANHLASEDGHPVEVIQPVQLLAQAYLAENSEARS